MIERCGKLGITVSDNGTELTTNAILGWFSQHFARQANKERLHREFQRTMRDELLNKILFRNLARARVVIAAWTARYSTKRPHSALDYQIPVDCIRTLTTTIVRHAARDDSFARRTIAQPAPSA